MVEALQACVGQDPGQKIPSAFVSSGSPQYDASRYLPKIPFLNIQLRIVIGSFVNFKYARPNTPKYSIF